MGSENEKKVFDKTEFTKIFKSKSSKQYSKYIQSEKAKDLTFFDQFKFKFEVNRIKLTPSQEEAIKSVSEYLEGKNYIGKSLYNVIYGKAGVGKSECINVIKQKFERKGLNVKVVGPTGYCVSQYDGAETLHSFLEIGIIKFYPGFVETIPSKKLMSKVKKLHCLIIDEGGLISAYFFQFLNARLKYLRRSESPFGGISIILILDPLQIPCINSHPLWASFDEVQDEFGRNGLREFRKFRFILLRENVRQSGDSTFEKLLDNFRYKKVGDDDIRLLKSRLFKNVSSLERKEFTDNAIHLFGTNAECEIFNKRKLDALISPTIELPVKLSKSIYLAVGCKVILTRNLWTQAGLSSGSSGVVTGFLFDRRSKVGVHLPTVVFVQFDRPLKIRRCELSSIPIPRVAEKIFDESVQRWKTVQTFPLLISFGITIARSQSATLPKAAILFGSEFLCQQSYVALSRLRNLKDLLILNDDISLDQFSNYNFHRGFRNLLSNLTEIGLDFDENKRKTVDAEGFDSEGDELIFQMEMGE
jgi:hypothetical protein